MQLIAYSIGADIACETFEAVIQKVYANRTSEIVTKRSFNNTRGGHTQFVKWVGKNAPDRSLVHVVMEATGRYYEDLAYVLFNAQYRLSVVLPNKIKNFARSLNEFSKNDPLDARIIATYGAMYNPPAWQPMSPMMRELRELSRERQSLKGILTQAKNRLHALTSSKCPCRDTVKRLKEQIKFFTRQIDQIEGEMDQLRDGDEALRINHALLCSIPFVGSVTAYTLLAETDGFALFENREQLIKYAGLDIIENQSGSSVRGKTRISGRGNARIRSAPYTGLAAVGNHDSVFGETYRRAIDKGMAKKQARTATVRQVLKVAFGVVKSGQPYCEDTHRNRAGQKVIEVQNSATVTEPRKKRVLEAQD